MALLRLVLCLILPGAWGHGQLTVPLVRGDSQGRRESYEQRAPVYVLGGNRGGYSATSYRCHDFQAESEAPTTLVAGESFQVKWTMEAGHPGDCYFYLSYDDASVATNFFKIAAIPGCGATDGLNIPSSVTSTVLLPAELPACEHCVLRWEWTGHQQVVDIEFYVQCADVKISSSAGPTKPSPVVAISGIEHLPAEASAYRNVYNGQGPEEQYLVGPAVATYTACSAGSAGCISNLGVDPIASTSVESSAPGGSQSNSDPNSSTIAPATSTTRAESATSTEQLDVSSCPIPGTGLPPFVSECYCGFLAEGVGCGPDDGTACWCRCCCHHRGGGCRYSWEREESSFSGGHGIKSKFLAVLPLAYLFS